VDTSTHCKENPIFVFLFWKLRSLSPNFHIHVSVSDLYSQDQSTYFPAAEPAGQSWKYINLQRIHECRNWETEHYNSVLEITVSILGIHKWEPDIYTGFSPALHFQCMYIFKQHRHNTSWQKRIIAAECTLNICRYPTKLWQIVSFFSNRKRKHQSEC
jgi:hypothetical protein